MRLVGSLRSVHFRAATRTIDAHATDNDNIAGSPAQQRHVRRNTRKRKAGTRSTGAHAQISAATSISKERLARIDTLMQQYVDENLIAGAVALILQNGQPVYEHAAGWADKEAGTRMSTDTIFRIASQTKALTSTAVLQLQEQGKLVVTDPVSKYIPEFAKTTVMVNGNAVPAKRPITLRDLLTHTAGISYGTNLEIAALYKEKELDLPRASAGTPPTRMNRSARPWSASARCRSSRSRAKPSCTATTPTFSAASSSAPRGCSSMNTSARTSRSRWA